MPVRNRPQKLKKILFSKLKNLENLEISFDDKQITGIFGTNGSANQLYFMLLPVCTSLLQIAYVKISNSRISSFQQPLIYGMVVGLPLNMK